MFLWPFVALLIYLSVQGLTALPTGIAAYFQPDFNQAVWMGVALLVSSVVTTVVLCLMEPYALRTAFSGLGCDRTSAFVAIGATLFSLFAFDIVNEKLDLPNNFEELFTGLSSNVWGMLAISIFGPICEEVVFRGGIMNPLLNRGVNPWVAILTSAVVFGLIHGNPAQIPFAMMVGVVFGIIYCRTRSLIITSFCHILNNSFSVILMNIYGNEANDLTIEKILGTDTMWTVFVLSAIGAALLLWLFWDRTRK